MKTKIWIYQCTNHSSQCNKTERKVGPRRSQIHCDNCGGRMNLIGSEEVGK